MSLSSHTRILEKTEAGSIILIASYGDYPPGSVGNEAAQQMKTDVTNAVAEFSPVAVVFDLSELKYVWGDAIAGIFWALRRSSHDFLLSAVVARGETRKALMDLLTQTRVLNIFHTDFFDGIDQALGYLDKLLSKKSSSTGNVITKNEEDR
jgi:hypothetical protein